MNYCATVIALTLTLAFSATKTSAQTYRYGAGVIAVEEHLLTSNQKQISFLVTQDIPGPATLQLEMLSMEGLAREYPILTFKDGFKKGQVIPLWNGEFTVFDSTSIMSIYLQVTTPGVIYDLVTRLAINHPESYQELMINSIKETPSRNGLYTYRLEGNFDNGMETHIVFNTTEVIPKSVAYGPGYMQFTISNSAAAKIPTGKFLLTICQELTCDSMVGRHR